MGDSFYASPVKTTYSPFSDTTTTIEDIVTPLGSFRKTNTARNSSNPYNPNNHPNQYPGAQYPGSLGAPYPGNSYPGAPFPNVPVNLYARAGLTTVFRPEGYYYDSGISSNPIARHDINKDIRHRFLDKWLYSDYPNILRMMRVNDKGNVEILSKEDSKNNDISKDSAKVHQIKSDYIGYNILTYEKNMKIMSAFCQKNNIPFFDLPLNHRYIRHEQGKYVKKYLAKYNLKLD
jgi:hypothetical protein